jgi:transposase-like protein
MMHAASKDQAQPAVRRTLVRRRDYSPLRRWYFRFRLSYRDLVEILHERGLVIAHTTILRWVVRYAETCEKRWRPFERSVGGSWRADETFIKVRGQLMYLYRAVDGQGNTVEFYLSRTRGIAAAKAFFRKALKRHRSRTASPWTGIDQATPRYGVWG